MTVMGFKPPADGLPTNAWRTRKCKNLAALGTDSQLAFPRAEVMDFTSKGMGTRSDDMIHCIVDEGLGQLLFDKKAKLSIHTSDATDRLAEIEPYLGLNCKLIPYHEFVMIKNAVREACLKYSIAATAEDLHSLAKECNFITEKPWEAKEREREEAEQKRLDDMFRERENALRAREETLGIAPAPPTAAPVGLPNTQPPTIPNIIAQTGGPPMVPQPSQQPTSNTVQGMHQEQSLGNPAPLNLTTAPQHQHRVEEPSPTPPRDQLLHGSSIDTDVRMLDSDDEIAQLQKQLAEKRSRMQKLRQTNHNRTDQLTQQEDLRQQLLTESQAIDESLESEEKRATTLTEQARAAQETTRAFLQARQQREQQLHQLRKRVNESDTNTSEWTCSLCGNTQDHTLCQGCGKEARPLPNSAATSSTQPKPFQPTTLGTDGVEQEQALPGATDQLQHPVHTGEPDDNTKEKEDPRKRARPESGGEALEQLKETQDKGRSNDGQPPDALILASQRDADRLGSTDPARPNDDTEAIRTTVFEGHSTKPRTNGPPMTRSNMDPDYKEPAQLPPRIPPSLIDSDEDPATLKSRIDLLEKQGQRDKEIYPGGPEQLDQDMEDLQRKDAEGLTKDMCREEKDLLEQRSLTPGVTARHQLDSQDDKRGPRKAAPKKKP